MAQRLVPGKPSTKLLQVQRPSKALNPIHGSAVGREELPSLKTLDLFKHLNGQANGYYVLPKTSALPKTALQANQKVALALGEVQVQLGLNQVDGSFLVKETLKDELGMQHTRFVQMHEGMEVWGAEMILHEKGSEQFLNGHFMAEPIISNKVVLSSSDALIKAIYYLKGATEWQDLSESQIRLTQYVGPKARKVVYPFKDKNQVCWLVDCKPNILSTWRCFVDAETGEIVNAYNQACTADGSKVATASDLNSVSRTINTYEKSGMAYMIDGTKSMFNLAASKLPDDPIGAVWTINAQNTYVKSIVHISSSTNSNWPAAGVSAHYNAGLAFDYYKNTHNRNSINGNGGTIISVINVSEQNGQGMDNAFWTGEMMCYGNGKVAFKPLAGSLDVAGHEMTHGVVQNTANLEYQGQSGAINESMADVFGCMMDRDDWLLGDDVVKTQYFPTGALRSLSDPHNGGSSLNDNGYQPRAMSEYYSGTQDNGGVHINSGIPNWAFYKFATAIGKDKAEKVYYRALSKYLTKSSKFVDLRIAVVQSCIDLHGDNSAEYNAARTAFNAVGIYATDPGGGGGTGGGGTNTAIDLQVNPGQDYILSYDASIIDPVTLYQSSTTATNYVAKSSRSMKRRPSVTDDGTVAVFVGSDSKIYKLTLSGSVTESVISSEAIWDNVAISKDGKRIAAITTSVDSSIYVYDFSVQTWQPFKLYNPTYSAGVNAGSVLYADALEFDYTGEKVVYDARTVITNVGGADIDYWDIGYMQVWNNAGNGYGTGKVEKLYSQLPADVNIGNPTFSKNSPYIMAFDYIDIGANKFAIIGKNILTNVDDIIALNDQVGYPNYSKLDDKLIYDVVTTQNQKWLAVVGLELNKITGLNDSKVLIPDAYWGTWYATGTRNLTSGGKDITAFSFPALVPPAVGIISGTNITVDIPFGTTLDFSKLIATFSASAFASIKVGTTAQISGVTVNNYSNSAATPLSYVVKAQDGSTKTYLVRVNSVNALANLIVLDAKIYPNPSRGLLQIDLPGLFTYSVLDLNGKLLLQGEGSGMAAIDLSAFADGLYRLQLRNDKGVKSENILVQHN
ncbi:MAG: M4 family metallopeptidase [bacterium]|nr:M4 family metallopeptidase [bacterium]